jgi:predicted amidohydrolase
MVGVVQMDHREDKAANIAKAQALVDDAVRQGASFVGLPEFFNYIGPEARSAAEPIPGPTIRIMQARARQHRIWLHCGSIAEVAPDGRYYNTTVVLDPDGAVAATYRKVHLFDAALAGREPHRESDAVHPGSGAVVLGTPWGPMGLTICYDLRFGELHRCETLAGARVIWGPAAFTLYTGKDHWEVLIRARAIENQVFMACPAKIGSYCYGTRQNFGSAMIVDPWGTVVARAPERECAVVAEIDFAWQDRIRRDMPVLEHRRPSAYRVEGGTAGS